MTYDDIFEYWGRHQGKVARAVGLSQPSVCGWQKNGIPFLRQQEISILTAGKLQPDIDHAPKKEQIRYRKVLAMSNWFASPGS